MLSSMLNLKNIRKGIENFINIPERYLKKRVFFKDVFERFFLSFRDG